MPAVFISSQFSCKASAVPRRKTAGRPLAWTASETGSEKSRRGKAATDSPWKYYPCQQHDVKNGVVTLMLGATPSFAVTPSRARSKAGSTPDLSHPRHSPGANRATPIGVRMEAGRAGR